MYRVSQDGWISASHQTPLSDGSPGPIHGHNWRVRVIVTATDLDDRGLVIDLDELQRLLTEVLDRLDHTHFNDLEFLQGRPVSAEGIATWIAEQLATSIDDGRRRLAKVRLWMTDEQSASFTR